VVVSYVTVSHLSNGAYGGILDHSDDTLATMIDTNVSGTVWPIRAVLPELLSHGGGNGAGNASDHSGGDIVIIASVAGLRGGRPRGGLRDHQVRADRAGRRPGPGLDADDVAGAVVTVLRQPRRMRTQLWTMWSMAEVG
jgi:3-oxoacyl-[acyl-carrier protein] reductase